MVSRRSLLQAGGALAVAPLAAGAAPAPRRDWQPRFPIRAAFYYPWFPEAWVQQGFDPFCFYHPSLGFYDDSAAVTAAHLKAMRYGHIEAGISSWWGPGSPTDNRTPGLLEAARGTRFKWAVYHETEGYGNPSVADLRADLTYVRDRYGNHPNYLRVDGRFVVFVYNADDASCEVSERWKEANTVGAYVVLKVFGGYRDCPTQPDGWHQYGPGVARDDQSPFAYTISPGFFKRDATNYPLLHRNPLRFATDIEAMMASNARFQLVTSFNEWGEGTSVESAEEWATASGHGTYLDILHRYPQR